MTKSWLRWIKHRWLDERDTLRALDDAALARLQARIVASEAGHSGEIRVAVEAGLPLSYLRRRLRPRDRAITLFGKLRLWDTEHNNGVLIYLLLADRAIEIVADRGLARAVAQPQWDALAQGLGADCREGRFEAGLTLALAGVDGLLRQHFALADGATHANELSDRVVRL